MAPALLSYDVTRRGGGDTPRFCCKIGGKSQALPTPRGRDRRGPLWDGFLSLTASVFLVILRRLGPQGKVGRTRGPTSRLGDASMTHHQVFAVGFL